MNLRLDNCYPIEALSCDLSRLTLSVGIIWNALSKLAISKLVYDPIWVSSNLESFAKNASFLGFLAEYAPSSVVGLLFSQIILGSLLALNLSPRLSCFVLFWILRLINLCNPSIANIGDVALAWLIIIQAVNPPRILSESYNTLIIHHIAYIGRALQLSAIYILSALSKWDSSWTSDYTAIEQVLTSEHATALRGFILVHKDLCRFATWGVMRIEELLPVMLLCSLYWMPIRTPMLLIAFSFHLLTWIFLSLGEIPIIFAAAWFTYIPRSWWEIRMINSLRRKVELVGGNVRERLSLSRHIVTVLGVLTVTLVSCTSIFTAIFYGPSVQGMPMLEDYFGLHQRWGVFSPRPLTTHLKAVGTFYDPIFNKIYDLDFTEIESNLSKVRWKHFLHGLEKQENRHIFDWAQRSISSHSHSAYPTEIRLLKLSFSYRDVFHPQNDQEKVITKNSFFRHTQ